MNIIENCKKELGDYFKNLPEHYYKLFWILAFNLVIRAVYIFYFTDYKNYLVTDMGAYWNRANARFNGEIFHHSQWTSYAFMYYLYLTLVFKILFFLQLLKFKLEMIIFFNIIYSTVSMIYFYLISVQLFKSIRTAQIATLFYALCYPLIYFNALILTENFAIPLLICCIWLLFSYKDKKLIVFLTGLLLGFTVTIRPAYGVLGLAFFIYIIYSDKLCCKSILRGILFSTGFAIIIFIAVCEIYYMSKGESISLYPNSTSNAFTIACKHSSVESHYKDTVFITTPPITSVHKEWTRFETDHPLHDQKYFHKLTLECIKTNPRFIEEKIANIKYLFFNLMFPYLLTERFVTFLLPISDWLIFFMTLSLGIIYFMFKDKDSEIDRKKILFLLSLPLSVILITFIFPPEQRYMHSVVFSIYLLFFVVYENYKKYKKEAGIYFKYAILALFLYLIVFK